MEGASKIEGEDEGAGIQALGGAYSVKWAGLFLKDRTRASLWAGLGTRLVTTKLVCFHQTCACRLESTFLPAKTASSWLSRSFRDLVE